MMAPLYSHAEPLDIKPGAWEMTMTTTTEVKSLPAETLDKLSDAQRARIESARQARAQATTVVSQDCITQADLDQDSVIKAAADARCRRTIISKSSSTIEIEQTCTAPQASSSNILIKAETPETILARMSTIKAGSRGEIRVDIKGRWLNASCAGITTDG
jgi:hypothetical protein